MEVLTRPADHEDRAGPEMWVDEAIWGHRLHDEQSPWLTVLEFLCVLHAEQSQGRALTETRLNELSYRPQTQLRLRNLLFNNPHMATVLTTDQSDEFDVGDVAGAHGRERGWAGYDQVSPISVTASRPLGFWFRCFLPTELSDRRRQQQALEFKIRFPIWNERTL